jgi:TrmH family RNA methyltransferase
VEGERALEEAGRSGNLLFLVLSDEGATGEDLHHFGARYPDIPCFTLQNRSFRELTDVRAGAGILGAARIPPDHDFQDLLSASGTSVVLFLDGLQEPGNVGGIIRTAWALGISGVLLGEGTADPFSAKGVRASAGGVFQLPLYRSVKTSDLKELDTGGFGLFLAEAGGSDYRNVEFPPRAILALGSEAHGFSRGLKGMGQPVGVPMVQGVNSLNVVVAGSIIAAAMTKV